VLEFLPGKRSVYNSIKEGDLHKPTLARGQATEKKERTNLEMCRKDRKSRINSTKNRRTKKRKRVGGEKDGGEKIDEAGK
jgi:hypothetical protein